jgi:anaerobic ribonucleoside-triphosphate reductase
LKAEAGTFSSAAESVSAAEDSLVAGIEADEASKALESTSDDNEEGVENNEKKEDVEEDYEESNNAPTEKELSGYINGEKNGELEKLMSESSDLAKELRLVFNVLAKRESQLINEMESLKKALTTAVSVLKESGTISLGQRRRREFVNVEGEFFLCLIKDFN